MRRIAEEKQMPAMLQNVKLFNFSILAASSSVGRPPEPNFKAGGGGGQNHSKAFASLTHAKAQLE